MFDRAHLLLPLASSLIYALGVMLLRRAADLGVDVWRTTFVANAFSAFVFAPLLLLGGPGQPLGQIWQPIVLAGLLVMGQLLGFLALTRGDVTIVTPVMGIKTIVVAALTPILLGVTLPSRLWLAAALSSGSIALLSIGSRGRRGRVGLGVVAGLVAACVFSLFNVLVQRWSPSWGAGRLLPLVMALCAIFSVAFVPLFSQPLGRIPRTVLGPLLMGSLCGSFQGILLISTLAIFGDSTAVNIVYSSRSLWTIIAVWSVGHWFHSTEQHLGPRILRWRLAGAILMTAAVLMAIN